MEASAEPGAVKMDSLEKEEQPAEEPGEAIKEVERGEKAELQKLQAEEEDLKKRLGRQAFWTKKASRTGRRMKA